MRAWRSARSIVRAMVTRSMMGTGLPSKMSADQVIVRPGGTMIRALLVAALLAGCGGSIDQADVPPAGDIWFGSSFDPSTFAISGRTDTVSTTEVFAFVGTLPSAMDGSELNIRVAYDGQQVSNQEANVTGSGEVFGFTYGPLFEPGTWTFEMTDVGGNVLASGDVTATE